MSKRQSRGATSVFAAAASVFAMALLTLALTAVQAEASEEPPKWHSNGHEVGTQHLPVTIWGEMQLNSEALGEGTEGEIHCQNVMGASVWNEAPKGLGEVEGWGTNACKAPELEKALNEIYHTPIEEGKIRGPLTVFATAEMPQVVELREAVVCSESNKSKLSECPNSSEREPQTLIWHARRSVSSFPWKIETQKGTRNGEKATILKLGVPPTGQTCYPKEKVPNPEEPGSEIEVPAKWEKVPSGCIAINVVAPEIPAEIVFYGTLEPRLVNGAGTGLDPSKLEFGTVAGDLTTRENLAPQTTDEGELKLGGWESNQLIFAK